MIKFLLNKQYSSKLETSFKNIFGILNKLSVGQKVMTIIGVEILSYSIVTSISLIQLNNMGNELRQIVNINIPLLSTVELIQQYSKDEALAIKDIVFFGDRVVYDEFANQSYIIAKNKFEYSSVEILKSIHKSKKMILFLEQKSEFLNSSISKFTNQLSDNLIRIEEAHDQASERVNKVFKHVEDGSFLMGMELLEGVVERQNNLYVSLNDLKISLELMKSSSVNYANDLEKKSSQNILFASFFTVLLLIVFFIIVVKKNISDPLKILIESIRTFDVFQTELTSKPEHTLNKRGDELGAVSRSFFELKQDLRIQGKALKSAKEEAERASLAKSRFMAAASHDLRQPLHAMQMYIAVMAKMVNEPKVSSILSDIQSVSDVTGQLLNAILDMSLLESEMAEVRLETFYLDDFLKRLLVSFVPLIQQKNLKFRVVQAKVSITSDRYMLGRIVGNFLSNAIRHTEKGEILVGCRRRDDKISIQVWDTGPGIPDNELISIFDDFYQLKNDERDESKGHGLGLGIAQRLAKRLNHTLEYKSSLGKGSYFGVVVDLSKNLPIPVTLEDHTSNYNITGTKVLLIEDDQQVSLSTALLLEAWGCIVLIARSSEEAMHIVKIDNNLVDVIIADFRLPGHIDGTTTIKLIEEVTSRIIPAIIVTGESNIDQIRELCNFRFEVLRKPIRPAKLRRLINNCFDNSK